MILNATMPFLHQVFIGNKLKRGGGGDGDGCVEGDVNNGRAGPSSSSSATTASRRRHAARQDYLLSSSSTTDGLSSNSGPTRINPYDVIVLDEYSPQENNKPSSSSSFAFARTTIILRLTTLIVLAAVFTIASHRYTYASSTYRLHYLGTYSMRGVPEYGRRRWLASMQQRRGGRTQQEEEEHQVQDREDSSSKTVDERSPSSSSSVTSSSAGGTHRSPPPPPPLPLMLPREFTNRRGDKITLPRGVPLPPPLLALVEVKMCSAASSSSSSSSNNNGGGEYECLRNNNGKADENDYGIALECAWCEGGAGGGGSCVPKQMKDVMCGLGASSSNPVTKTSR